MRKILLALALALLLLAPAAAQAAEAMKVVVFPFHVFSREPLTDLRGDVQKMLAERLSSMGVTVFPNEEVNQALAAAGQPLDLSLARKVAGRLGADFAVTGSITKIGNRVSLDAKVLDVLGMQRPQSVFVEGAGLDSIASLTERISRELAVRVSGREKVAEVKIAGNRRIESDAVKAALKTKDGGIFSPLLLDEDLRAVWKLGYFDDVKITSADSPKGKVVTITVKEKPVVRDVRFEGNKEIDTKDLQDQIGLKRFAAYKPAAVKEAEQKIIQMYRDKGYYDVKVNSQVITLPKGDLGIKFTIVEGEKVYVHKIEIRGNKAFSEKELKEIMSTGEKGWLSWIKDDHVLEWAKLEQDVQKLNDFYYNQGYMSARVGKPEVTRAKDGLLVTINIDEGPRFKVASVSVSGQLIVPQKELLAMIKTKAGGWYNREQLRNDLTALHELYANRGFAYVEVRPQVRQNMKTHSVALDFQVNKGAKVYFDRVIISGNTRTRDKVIRRELGVSEGDLFSATAIRQANMRLHRLNFFEDITISPSKGGAPGTMDLNIKVKEKRTGQISFGAGFSTQDSFMVMGQVTESNLFGRGQQVQLKGTLGGKSTRYTLSFTEPWLFDRPISFGVDIYDWEREYIQYNKTAIGGRLRWGFPTPLAYTRFYLYYKFEEANITDINKNASLYVRDQEGWHTTSSLKGIIRRDTRDANFNTTRGSDNNLSTEWAGGVLGGTNAFYKIIANTGWYFPMWWETVLVLHGQIGWMEGHSGGDLPIYEKFFLGGINTLRGFSYQSVSPRDENGDLIGGERMFVANFEVRFPLFKKAGLTGVVFYDTGNAWTADQGYDFGMLRKSVGCGIRWMSPMGPLRLEYGYVLDPEPGDDTSNFEFTVGGMF
ncbi:MAG: outer membrane protein assembly factor BamA [Proteobacteria bacterium]|nr:outer membrane protein assembly factor BamA [Pseudomonadota bacterium]MBU1453002.1 outer membrane protein assembly factor BamA [Pseudomonadota bacterium]